MSELRFLCHLPQLQFWIFLHALQYILLRDAAIIVLQLDAVNTIAGDGLGLYIHIAVDPGREKVFGRIKEDKLDEQATQNKRF